MIDTQVSEANGSRMNGSIILRKPKAESSIETHANECHENIQEDLLALLRVQKSSNTQLCLWQSKKK